MGCRRTVLPALLSILLAACAAVPAPRPGPGATRIYIVERGDTLSEIARGLGVNMKALAAENGLAAPYTIRPGQRLRLPGSGRYAPAPRPAPAPAPAPPPAPTATATPVIQPLADMPQSTPAPRMDWPSDSPVTLRFGAATAAGKPNAGLDFALHPGQRIISAAGGTVLFAGIEPTLGQVVVIDHGGGWVTAYAFAGQITVREGDPVKFRERIGVNGRSGTLHFEVRRDNVPRDPLPFLPPRL